MVAALESFIVLQNRNFREEVLLRAKVSTDKTARDDRPQVARLESALYYAKDYWNREIGREDQSHIIGGCEAAQGCESRKTVESGAVLWVLVAREQSRSNMC